METSLQAHIHSLATDVRYWAEGRAAEPEWDLNGWCAKASAHLFKQLKDAGIASEIHAWVDSATDAAHVYLVVDDHVVDVTATQFREFRNKPVVIMHCREAQEYEFYESVSVFQSVEDLQRWQKKNRWPPNQIAFN